jgi:uncharacterized delta-60 repeat protein
VLARLPLAFTGAALVASLALAGSASAAPGDPDAALDGDGKLTHNIGMTPVPPNDVAVGGLALQSDGKLVAAGYSGTDFAVARYNPDGSLDTSFSEDGLQTTDFGGADFGHAVAIQADGRIVVAGRIDEAGANDWGLVRYDTDGTRDVTFGTQGKVTTDLGGGDSAYRVAIQPDQRIVVVGGADEDGASDFGVVRYDSDGSRDVTFGDRGKVITDFGGFDYADGVAIQDDDKIVVGGSSGNGALDFAVARYDADGSPDPAFSKDGRQTTNLGGDDDAADLALQPDGGIVVAGETDAGRGSPLGNFGLVRYDPDDGSLDTSFSDDGKRTTDFARNHDGALGVAVQPDGKIVAAGYSAGNLAIARHNGDGSLDTGFAGDGRQTTDFGSFSVAFGALAIHPDGKIAAAGFAVPNSEEFALARYQTDGELDETFSDDGMVTTGFPDLEFRSRDTGEAVAVQPDGKILVAGGSDVGGGGCCANFALTRFDSDGTPDFSFGSGGTAITDFGGSALATGVAVQADGKIVTVGPGRSVDGFAVARYNPDGSPDTSFSGDGKRVDNFSLDGIAQANDVAIQADGKIVVVGEVVFAGNEGFAVARYDPDDGSLDSGFSGDGYTTAPVGGPETDDDARAVAIQPDGKIVAAGVALNPDEGGSRGFALARLDSDGDLDPSFSGDGTLTTRIPGAGSQAVNSGDGAEAEAVALQPDGKIVAVGSAYGQDFEDGTDFALARYESGGEPDTTFSGDGQKTTDIGDGSQDVAKGVVIQPDGGIVAVGSGGGGFFDTDFVLARYGPGGALDTSFSGDGKQTTDFGDSGGSANGVALLPGGQLLLAGTGGESDLDLALAQYKGGGTAPPERTLSVAVAGGGRGFVRGPGIDCPGACAESYSDGTSVTLEAIAKEGSTFAGWDDDCSGSGDCDLTMTADREATAMFVPTAECDGRTATIVGDESDDTLVGTEGRDVIAGLFGDDVIRGLGDNDVLCGGLGRDTLRGGDGTDVCKGGRGRDSVASCERGRS